MKSGNEEKTTRRERAEITVQIDELRLGDECVNLPHNYLQAAHQAADSRRDVEYAKNELEVVDADLCKHIRSTPGKYGLEKVTESAIKEIVVLQPPYKEAQSRLIKSKHRQDLDQALVSALEHKKRALAMLVDLHTSGYFSEVKPTTAEGRQSMEQKMKERIRTRGQRREEEEE